MRKLMIMCALAALMAACGENKHLEAEALLEQASSLFDQGNYDEALTIIDSLRKVYPNAIDTRKRALTLQQNVELKQTQEELAVVDSMLQAVIHDYEYQRQKVEKDKQALRATPEELTMLTRTRMRRDSVQTRFDVLCAKIRYIHKKQKEL